MGWLTGLERETHCGYRTHATSVDTWSEALSGPASQRGLTPDFGVSACPWTRCAHAGLGVPTARTLSAPPAALRAFMASPYHQRVKRLTTSTHSQPVSTESEPWQLSDV